MATRKLGAGGGAWGIVWAELIPRTSKVRKSRTAGEWIPGFFILYR